MFMISVYDISYYTYTTMARLVGRCSQRQGPLRRPDRLSQEMPCRNAIS